MLNPFHEELPQNHGQMLRMSISTDIIWRLPDIFKRLSLLEMTGPMDVIQFTDMQGVGKFADYIANGEFRGNGAEGIVWEQNFEFSQGGKVMKDQPNSGNVVKIFNKWRGAVGFFHYLYGSSYTDEKAKDTIRHYMKIDTFMDLSANLDHIAVINRRNKLFSLIPNNSLPVNTIYLSPENQIMGFSCMKVEGGTWLNWHDLTSDEKSIFNSVPQVINMIDHTGQGNFVRYYAGEHKKILMVDPMF